MCTCIHALRPCNFEKNQDKETVEQIKTKQLTQIKSIIPVSKTKTIAGMCFRFTLVLKSHQGHKD